MGIFDNAFTHWLGDRTGIHSLKPVAQIAAPIAGGLLGGPMGAGLGAGLFSAGDDLAHGKGIMDAAKHGLINGGLAYGGAKALGALQHAFAPGSAPSTGFGASAGQGGSEAGASIGAASGPAVPYGAMGAADTPGGSGGLMGALKGIGSFAEKNPNAIGMGLQGAGSIASAGSENALRNAQAAQLMAQTQAQEDENAAKKQRAAALEPLLRALMGGGGIKVAANPYAQG